jgi:PAS domain-containing protein
MVKQPPQPDTASNLRTKAKRFLAKKAPEGGKIPLIEVQKLVHELDTYQVEMDIQNKELQRHLSNLEVIRARYAELFDFAPIGYFTFDPRGLILEVNLSGARLLGQERSALIHTPIFLHIAPPIRSAFAGSFCRPSQAVLYLTDAH